jgi:antitoxin CptB
MDIATRVKKVLYRAHHRGFKEADILLGGFADAQAPRMSAGELDAFEALLELPDQELYAWITGNAVPPDDFDNPMLDRVRQFGYSDRPITK